MVAAQVAHAAGSGSERHPPEVHVVVLAVPDEDALRDISARLLDAEIAQTLVTEVDEPYAQQAMSIGLELLRDRAAVSRILSSLPLLREPSHAPALQKGPHRTEASSVGLSADDLPILSVPAAQRNQAGRSTVVSLSAELESPQEEHY